MAWHTWLDLWFPRNKKPSFSLAYNQYLAKGFVQLSQIWDLLLTVELERSQVASVTFTEPPPPPKKVKTRDINAAKSRTPVMAYRTPKMVSSQSQGQVNSWYHSKRYRKYCLKVLKLKKAKHIISYRVNQKWKTVRQDGWMDGWLLLWKPGQLSYSSQRVWSWGRITFHGQSVDFLQNSVLFFLLHRLY